MSSHPLDIIKKMDRELFDRVTGTGAEALKEGALSRKNKLLIAFAIDAEKGAVNGVRSLAAQALEAGASKEELADALKVVHYIAGVGAVYTAAQALTELFKED